jgi:hypothetical protein
LLELGHVRPPRGAICRTVAWPISLWRVEVTAEESPDLPDPFTSFLLDAAQAGPLDLRRLAKLSGLPIEFLEDRLAAAQSNGWISSQLLITPSGDRARLVAPEVVLRGGWMAECRRTGQILPAFFSSFPRGARFDADTVQVAAEPIATSSSMARQLDLQRAWKDHQRRQKAGEEREEEGGTDLLIEESVEVSNTVELEGRGPQRSDKLTVRLQGRGDWHEARLELWVEVETHLPQEHAIQVFAGCPVGWKRRGARYLRLLERIPEGAEAIAHLFEEGKKLYRERMTEAVDQRWAEHLAEAQVEMREGLRELPPLLDRELSDLVRQRLRATVGTDPLRGPLGQCRVVVEQLLIALMDDHDLVNEAQAFWKGQTGLSKKSAPRFLEARLRALLPEDDQGVAFEIPRALGSELERWAKSPPFQPAPTHGQMLLLHPFVLAALARENPAALAIRAMLERDRRVVERIQEVFRLCNPSHHGGTREEQRAQQEEDLKKAEDRLRQLLRARFPADLGPPAAPIAAAMANSDPQIYEDLQF